MSDRRPKRGNVGDRTEFYVRHLGLPPGTCNGGPPRTYARRLSPTRRDFWRTTLPPPRAPSSRRVFRRRSRAGSTSNLMAESFFRPLELNALRRVADIGSGRPKT